MRNSDVQIRKGNNCYILEASVPDYQVIGLLGKAQQAVQGDKEQGTFFYPQQPDSAPNIKLFYELQDSGVGKITVVSTESKSITLELLKAAVDMIMERW